MIDFFPHLWLLQVVDELFILLSHCPISCILVVFGKSISALDVEIFLFEARSEGSEFFIYDKARRACLMIAQTIMLLFFIFLIALPQPSLILQPQPELYLALFQLITPRHIKPILLLWCELIRRDIDVFDFGHEVPVINFAFEVVDFTLQGGVGLLQLGDFLLDVLNVEMALLVVVDEALVLFLKLLVLVAEGSPVDLQLQSLGLLLVSLLCDQLIDVLRHS